MIVSGILNFILGILMTFPYVLFQDCVFGGLKGTKEGRDWLIVAIIPIIFAIGINGLMYFIYNRSRKKADKELNNLKYWLINIILHFIPLIVIYILLTVL